ncbi:putative Transmembrane protein [Cocos nucifera]|uniref:Putative Transmembrane protein n=1 Tax=Cocos nucifera TaxID=13894 RepID=A0A8K0MUL2_COCNU|nr:putative Transmembrane protein [Cocos nucifera]
MTNHAAGETRQPPRPQTDNVLHQRRSLPKCPAAMAVGGFLMVATLGYFTLFAKSKPNTTPSEVAKVVAGSGDGSAR